MASNLGNGVSYAFDPTGFNYDEVIFQKGKPPLDSEMNLMQELQNAIAQKGLSNLPSGWISLYPYYTSRTLANGFYTQNPTGARPEFALINGKVVLVTNTNTQTDNANLIYLGEPPQTGNRVNGVFLEMWRSLLDPNTIGNPAVKPDPETIIDTFRDIFMHDTNNGWVCGDNGLILGTQNGGESWNIQSIETQRQLNGIHFVSSTLGWVVGNNGVMARSSSGGQKWTLLTEASVENLKSVFAISQLTAWAVGDAGTILKTTNGVSFVPKSSGVTTNLNKVYFLNASVGWVVGESGLILKTVNGGETWGIAASGTSENLNSIFFYDLNFGFAVGDNGTILRSSDGGASWVSQSGNIKGGSTTEDLKDVNMVPTLDRQVLNEEVSSQLGPYGVSFTTLNKPITVGDGLGTVTLDPLDVEVRVDGTRALVDSINGNSGFVLLNTPPGSSAVTKVSYNYRSDSAVFEGKAWIVGTTGRIFDTTNIGQTWRGDATTLGYDFYAASFVTQQMGWICGAESKIYATTDGITWEPQSSDVFPHQSQRVYFEGNRDSSSYIPEETIHPDAKIETTKRVQVQYRIRVLEAADADAHPEAGLSSSVYGQGPNDAGSFAYENMGPINGDYGCWRAKCLNTVDDYCYAIPMAFVNRRNSGPYHSYSNPNGEHRKLVSVRPDLLLATSVVDSDIMDVRRKVNFSDTKFLQETFDALSSNNLKTNFGHTSTTYGVWYGTELLQTDRIGGNTNDGGSTTSGSITDILAGKFSSESSLTLIPSDVSAGSSIPPPEILTANFQGIFHTDPSHFKAYYEASSALNGKPVPGNFTGLGSSTVTFTFDNTVATTVTNPGELTQYVIQGDFISDSSESLNYTPYDPKLVKNYASSSQAFYYQGVLDTVDSKVLESWDSGIPSYQNYSSVYSAKDVSDTTQKYRASPVELHAFIRVSDTTSDPELTGGVTHVLSGTNLRIKSAIYPNGTGDVPYNIFTIRKIYNVTSGFSHRIQSLTFSTPDLVIQPVAGYEFVKGTILEITAAVQSAASAINTRNGAAVNFDARLKKIDRFTKSDMTVSIGNDVFYLNAKILGWSTTETASSLTQAICWDGAGSMQQATITRVADNEITLSVSDAAIQLLIQETALTYEGAGSGILISYNRIPLQCQTLPPTLTIEPVSSPSFMYVSNLGSGGGTAGEPYEIPLEHIPVNSSSIDNDNLFNNLIHMQLANYLIDSGFVQLPVTIPGNFSGKEFTLSSPTTDNLSRSFYSHCSCELKFRAEGLQKTVPRKIYLPMIAKVKNSSLFMSGEYVLIIFSRPSITDKENITGYFTGGNCSISVYRLPNRPINR
jgi:photosystem II stability/assembly factor-like uncharacterized protein